MIDVYVDTASTSGGDGTTAATTGANRAFATLLDAINSLPATLTDATTIHCVASTGVADTTNISQTPFDMVTAATKYLLIQGNNRTGLYQTAAPYYRLEITNPGTGVLYNNIPSHLRIDAIQMKITQTDASGPIGFKGANANATATDADYRFSNCIAWGVVTGGSFTGFESRPMNAAGAAVSRYWNCLALHCTNGFQGDLVGHVYDNCTAAKCGFGFVDSVGSALTLRNCLSTGATNIGFVGPFGDIDYCCEDDGNGVAGAHSHSLQTFTFVDAANDDYHLAATDAGARNLGLDDPSGGMYLDDVDGQTRVSPWDVGFDEYVVGSLGTVWGYTA